MTASPPDATAGVGTVADRDEELRVGEWTLTLRNGVELAKLSIGGVLALRSIRFVVRDEDWRTADVLDSVLDQKPDRVTISGQSGFAGQPVVAWRLDIGCGASRGALSVAVEARVLRSFRRNRIGLVALHPPQLAGTALTVIHTDGAREATGFPERISPHQPVLDVAGYEWGGGGQHLSLSLTGDVFEMEDQRNWTDASFKTYSTPLADPFPVEVPAGEVIRQGMILTASPGGLMRSSTTRPGGTDPFAIRPAAAAAPRLQLGASTGPDAAVAARAEPTTILVEVPADEPIWRAVLARAAREAAGGALDVRIIASDAAELGPVLTALDHLKIARVGVFDRSTHISEPELLAALCDAAGARYELVAGTRAHFTELNRTIETFDDWDGALTFSITPQMHDRSAAQLVESLAMQRLVAENAVRLAGERPLHIGPITLRPRFNAVATTPFVPSFRTDLAAGYGAECVLDATDPRQHTPWVQAWWQASIAALSVPGVATLTYFEASGPRGVPRA